MLNKIKQAWSSFMHGHCIQANIDAYNKQRKLYTQDVGALQDKVSDLQAENLRLHKEILFTQESHALEKRNQARSIEESHVSYD